MFDLSGIARHLKLNIDQLRTAADLIEQGFSTSFIEKYRGDETNALPDSVLRRLKYEIDRRKRTEASKQKLAAHLPKDSSPDAELDRALAEAHSALAVDVAMRCFRARRMLEQSQERSGNAGKLLEAMLTYAGPPVEDVKAWVANQIGSDQDVDLHLTQVSRLIATLMSSDTSLNNKLRNYIERNAIISVEEVTSPSPPTSDDTDASNEVEGSETLHDLDAEAQDHESHVDNQPLVDDSLVSGDSPASDVTDDSSAIVVSHDLTPSDSDKPDDGSVLEVTTSTDENICNEVLPAEGDPNSGNPPKKKVGPPNSHAKLTPRQRRRRWLQGVLNSMRSLSRPLYKLSAYQQLMLARGVRSHLISTPLSYDLDGLIDISRNAFTDSKHPFSDWFRHAVGQALEHGLRVRIEADALAEMEERASENLLEHATDELRRHLMRRPVRGHTIALIDTVGPKTVCVVFVDPVGKVLACEELPCSVQPEIVNQNVVRLGEWIHRYRVTLVALTNGPARRFMLATLRELMQQSKESGLRWTMADRSGAEAYAGGRIGLRELSIYNRRQRAAIWTARSLQDPLVELLKVDINRMRLGSYQRELPQDAIREQIQETLAACVCARGIDTQNASEFELQLIPGVGADQAKQIVELARTGCLKSRSQMSLDVQGWADQDRRHAIGWLRVFGGESALDATLIHPEDYRLAQRLIDHPDFNAPPNAPPGWSKRSLSLAEVPESNQKIEIADVDSSLENSQQADENAQKASMEEVLAESQLDPESSPETVVTDDEDSIADRDKSGDLQNSTEENSTEENSEVGSVNSEEDSANKDSVEQNSSELGNQGPSAEYPEPEYPEQCLEVKPAEIKIDCDKIANQWQVGRAKLRSVASCLMDPFGDPRLSGVPIPLHSEMPTLENLQPDMCAWAVVFGVADFGAFVELGPNCSGLIHISRLSTQFIEDPHQCVQVGDLLLTWVVSIDRKKNRVALTALSPAQRIQMQEAAEAKRSREDDDRQQRNRGYRKDQHQDRSSARGQRYGTAAGASGNAAPHQNQSAQGREGSSGRSFGEGRGQGTGQVGQGNRGQGNRGQGNRGQGNQGQGNRGDGRQGQGRQGGGQSGTGRRAAGQSGQQSGRAGGNRSGAAGSHRGSGRDSGGRSAKTVVVTSKKPVAPISQAMKQGEEPLRSFSDLMQFYESKREEPEVVEKTQIELLSDVDSQSVAGESMPRLDSDATSTTTELIADTSESSGDSDEKTMSAEHPDTH